jgi:hypothetical protein
MYLIPPLMYKHIEPKMAIPTIQKSAEPNWSAVAEKEGRSLPTMDSDEVEVGSL